jgi:hypothetical protein
MIFVSEAEVDAVERRLKQSESPALEPPDRGLVAIAASLPALAESLRDEAPKAARLLADGTELTGFADVQASGIMVDLDFGFREPRRVQQAARALTLLSKSVAEAGGHLGKLIASMNVEVLTQSVAVRFDLPPEVIIDWLGCDESGACE